MLKLGVNIDHVATLRQARLPAGRQVEVSGVYPDPAVAALVCQKAGANSIVMHLREDRRHIQDEDLFRVKRAIKIRLNLEMSIEPSILQIATRLLPDQATLVPEKRQERTTESGLDLFKNHRRLTRVVLVLRKKGIEVSLFIDPDPRQVREAVRLGADAVEFHTGVYANAVSKSARRKEWRRIKDAVDLANRLGITAHAGHGLDYRNVLEIHKIQGINELNIGYSIITRALWVGLENAVKEMRRLLS